MTPQENKTMVRRFFEEVDEGDVAVVDKFIGRNYDDHNPPPFPGLAHGFEGAKQAFELALAAFSDFHHTIEDQVAEGDLVVTRLTAYGTHTGELLGIPPTGKRVTMTGITIHRIADGKLVEHWAQIDALGLLQQLGAIPAPDQTEPPEEANKAIIRRFVEEVISKGNLSVADELIATNYIYHGPGMEIKGPNGIKQVFTMLRGAFPDWYETIESLVTEGDKVVFRVTGHGTHKGEFMGVPATGNQVTMEGIDIVRLEKGKLVEHWANFDLLGIMQQLGVISAPE